MHVSNILVLLALTVASTGPVFGQQEKNWIRRIVIFDGGSPNSAVRSRVATIKKKIQAKGWIEGKNAQYSIFFGESNARVAQSRIEAIVALKPDIICVSTGNAAHRVKARIRDIPVVFVHVSNALESGLVRSFSRPDANLTGVATWNISATQKLVETLHSIAPQIKTVATIFIPVHSARKMYNAHVAQAAAGYGWAHQQFLAKDKAELMNVLEKVRKLPSPGIVLLPDPNAVGNASIIAKYTREHRIPTIAGFSRFTKHGGLISYSTNFDRIYDRVANMIDRILRGAPVSRLPVLVPDQYELTINLKAFQAFRLAPPMSLLVRATTVLE